MPTDRERFATGTRAGARGTTGDGSVLSEYVANWVFPRMYGSPTSRTLEAC
jgi:hypothetical protein